MHFVTWCILMYLCPSLNMTPLRLDRDIAVLNLILFFPHESSGAALSQYSSFPDTSLSVFFVYLYRCQESQRLILWPCYDHLCIIISCTQNGRFIFSYFTFYYTISFCLCVLLFQASDSGKPSLSTSSWIFLRVIGNSQYKPSVSPLEIFIVMVTDTFEGGPIGRIYATDRDPNDMLSFTQKLQAKSMFRINRQDGSIVALPGLEPGRYTLTTPHKRTPTHTRAKCWLIRIKLFLCHFLVLSQIPDECHSEWRTLCCDSWRVSPGRTGDRCTPAQRPDLTIQLPVSGGPARSLPEPDQSNVTGARRLEMVTRTTRSPPRTQRTTSDGDIWRGPAPGNGAARGQRTDGWRVLLQARAVCETGGSGREGSDSGHSSRSGGGEQRLFWGAGVWGQGVWTDAGDGGKLAFHLQHREGQFGVTEVQLYRDLHLPRWAYRTYAHTSPAHTVFAPDIWLFTSIDHLFEFILIWAFTP